MRHQWLMEGEAILMVFSLDSPQSLDTARNYLEHERIRSGHGGTGPGIDRTHRKTLLYGNKSDLPRKVTRKQGLALARKLRVGYLEGSAKTREGVEEAFEALFRMAAARRYIETHGGGGAATDEKKKKCGIQ